MVATPQMLPVPLRIALNFIYANALIYVAMSMVVSLVSSVQVVKPHS